MTAIYLHIYNTVSSGIVSVLLLLFVMDVWGELQPQ